MATESNRVWGLDILKAICAFLVITAHAPFPGVLGSCVIALARIAVPIFFMITGYFYLETQRRKNELSQIKKILMLCFFANALYFLLGLFLKMFAGKEQIAQYLSNAFSLKSIVKFLVLNESPFAGHLWYLGAILYVLIIVFFLYRTFPKSANIVLMVVTPLLLVTDLIFGKYSLLLLQREYPYILVRNFLCVGIPYFSIGLFLKKYDRVVLNLRANRLRLLVLTLLFVCTTILEKYLLNHFHLSSPREHYLSTTFLSIFVFSIFTSHYWDGRMPFLYRIGMKYSTNIYIIHPILITVLSTVLRRIPIFGLYSFCRPIVVFALSILLSKFYYKFRTRLSKHGREKAIE